MTFSRADRRRSTPVPRGRRLASAAVDPGARGRRDPHHGLRAVTMIARIWRGVVRTPDADTYGEYIRETGLSGYAAPPGSRGAWLLRRALEGRTEFVTFTLWESVDAVKGF